MSKVVYVSCFNQRLYDFCGGKLVKSFLQHNVEGRLLLGLENVKIDDTLRGSPERVQLLDLSNEPLYWDWYSKFKEYIPPCYGGTKEDWSEYGEDNKRRDFNTQTSRWFWKVCILKRALEVVHENDTIFFIDSDCIFRQTLSQARVAKFLGENDWGFMMGPWRRQNKRGLESSVMQFKGRGRQVIEWCYDRYISGDYLKEEYWADSMIWESLVRDKGKEIKYIDYVSPSWHHGHVIENTIWGKFIHHAKGSVARAGVNK